jgi:hypothetical protein
MKSDHIPLDMINRLLTMRSAVPRVVGTAFGEITPMTFKTILCATIATSALLLTAAPAMATGVLVQHGGKPNAQGVAPKFAVIRRLQPNWHGSLKPLPPTWVESYTYKSRKYSETFIGTNPTGGVSTTVPVYIVPIKVVYGSTSYDPTVVQANGVSVIQNVLNSPLFNSSVDYVQGGTNLGTTQYEDAFQRGTLWGTVSSHTGYHVLLSTTVEPVQTVTIPTKNGKLINAFGATNLIMANINTYDPKITALISALGIPSNALPQFITTQVYLSSTNSTSGCCIGGYHSTSGGQPYSDASYITTVGAFAQDVSALSHELGEWIDDPYTNNNSPCGIFEVGDPLEGNTNYGGYKYTVGGVTWNLQDLALLPYFGAPTSTSVNGWSTFQGETLGVCANGS